MMNESACKLIENQDWSGLNSGFIDYCYLGNVVGVPYAKLALQVVTNEGRSGYIANKHAANRAKELGAVAAQWEADTARAQQIAGDPYAGLSEDNENFCTNTLTVSACPSNFIKMSHKNAMLCVTNRLVLAGQAQEPMCSRASNFLVQRCTVLSY